MWDATTQVPEMLLTIPATAGQERLRAVTALEVRVVAGIEFVVCWQLFGTTIGQRLEVHHVPMPSVSWPSHFLAPPDDVL